ncbi:hypothetical protein [Streptomyces scopuliridis]|uniref:hypothetical protein n=1 Tax=Streptomyces scopuliridis TaxID=452529 RepID=UPI0012FF075A|nr:hypothetical protein [Streptomyces scopuliridis]
MTSVKRKSHWQIACAVREDGGAEAHHLLIRAYLNPAECCIRCNSAPFSSAAHAGQVGTADQCGGGQAQYQRVHVVEADRLPPRAVAGPGGERHVEDRAGTEVLRGELVEQDAAGARWPVLTPWVAARKVMAIGGSAAP